jgi:Protein of unknown function (DUF3574)
MQTAEAAHVTATIANIDVWRASCLSFGSRTEMNRRKALGRRSIMASAVDASLVRAMLVCVAVFLLGPTVSVGAGKPSASATAAPVRTACEEPFARTELFFGSARPDGSAVTEEDFRNFLDKEITPRFPDGLTLLVGNGQFKHGAGIVRERSFVLILLHPGPTPASSANVEAIRQAYKTRFAQDSVLRVDSPTTRVCF